LLFPLKLLKSNEPSTLWLQPAADTLKGPQVSIAPAPPNARTEQALEQNEIAKTQYPTYAHAPGRRHFWLRRLQSIAGILFGGYVVVHLIVNATGLWPKVYQQNVDKIASLQPMLPLIEILAIFGPLMLHLIYGIYIASAGVKFNTTCYNYGGNVRYLLQRVTAYILLAFLIYHVGTLHHWGLALFGVEGYPMFNPKNVAYQTTVRAIQTPYENSIANVAVIVLYLVGVWSAVFHFANGLWTAAIAWGLTITANAQRKWGHVCLGFGIIMLIVGTTAWYAFAVKGDASVPKEKGVKGSTWTLPHEISEELHAQDSSGKQTKTPTPAGQIPATQNDSQPATNP
jgi:succinate dehydrogenase / fumarate reductase cytochrome b subunit